MREQIRPIALGLIRNDDTILVFKAEDQVNGKEFYRLLGGGIEYGEESETALRREFKEEIGAELESVNFIDVIENIFEYEGEVGHEIVFLFEAKLKDKAFYKGGPFPINDSKKGRLAEWVKLETLMGSNFYPEGVLDYI